MWAGRAQSLPQAQVPKTSSAFAVPTLLLPPNACLPCWEISPRLTCTVSSAYGSGKLMKCAEGTKRSLFPPAAPRRRLIPPGPAASQPSEISAAINAAAEQGSSDSQSQQEIRSDFLWCRGQLTDWSPRQIYCHRLHPGL